ncbi:hypothetical protein AB205_0008470 [Aquarana catesbeiana]|uniref:CARD domain-containing protein n=1 Tax=Aquarana catesbeiana TaxID=8400 RepID=A0A2G9RTC1_AQUCT|nr:hypothetical protein AB205_0008470 [Aquarana catesbeiana]
MNGTPSTSSSPSESGRARTFLQKNKEKLCHRLGLLEPILLSLNEKRIITDHEEQSIKSHSMNLQQNRALLNMVESKGAEEEFYKILKKENECLVQSLEQPT